MDLSAFSAFEVRLLGDGRRYKLNLHLSGDEPGRVYQCTFATDPGAWQTIRMPLEAFLPRLRGRPFAGTLDRRRVSGLGLLISDQQAGAFRLEVSSIAAT